MRRSPVDGVRLSRPIQARAWTAAAAVVVLATIGCREGGPEEAVGPAPSPATVVVAATVVDGSGAPARVSNVRLEGDRIVAVGDVEPEPQDLVVDGSGLILAPGFIDTHSHADAAIFEMPEALGAVSQGITTVVVGADGDSPYPLAGFFARLESEPPAINVASWGGHNTYRRQILGQDFRRPATPDEIDRMRGLLRQDLAAGALGLSTGLEYDPGIYSETTEVVELAKEAAAQGGRYTSHIRSEDRDFWAAIDEILDIGSAADIPVNITHIKLAMQSSWGKTDQLLAVLDDARGDGIDVTADIYPYTYWQSTLEVMFPARDFRDPEAARFAVSELSSPEQMLIAEFAPAPELAGETLAAIAAERGTDPATTLVDLVQEAQELKAETGADEVESIIAVSMDEGDIERLLEWPYVNICTDGELAGSHPRGFGSFSRVLGRYVRQRRILGLEEAIHKMTGRAASSAGLRDRGLIATQGYADLVLFDPKTVLDRATTAEPHAVSEGIRKVWVNGELVWDRQRPTGLRPGRVVRR